MGQEIERKFLVRGEAWRTGARGTQVRQGFLPSTGTSFVRVRRMGQEATLTIKATAHGFTRLEYEYPIPAKDADEILDRLCERPLIEKMRYKVDHAGATWEIDEFRGENDGLIIAEIELEREDESVELPEWAGREVTDDPRYLNVNLAKAPYSTWRDSAPKP
jgi:adenylate cyclase